jgi:hypothetical protein
LRSLKPQCQVLITPQKVPKVRKVPKKTSNWTPMLHIKTMVLHGDLHESMGSSRGSFGDFHESPEGQQKNNGRYIWRRGQIVLPNKYDREVGVLSRGIY